MIFGSSDADKFVRNLVNEFGEDFDDFDSQVKDSVYLHYNPNEAGLNKQLLDLYQKMLSKLAIFSKIQKDIYYIIKQEITQE